MKKLTVISVLVFAISVCNAQPFIKGTNVIGAGIGLGSSILNYSGSSQSPAISLTFEHGAFEAGDDGVISLGGYLGMKSYKCPYGSDYSYKWNYTIVGVRSAYHYNGLGADKFDLYGGVMLSYNILKYKYTGSDIYYNDGGSYGSDAGFTAFAGGRYFFNKKIAVMAEVGYGVSYLTLGLALKL